MRSNFILLCLGLLSACGGGIDDGEPFVGCTYKCGPGAITSGRFIASSWAWASVAMSPQGKMSRGVGDELAWLNDDFTTIETTSFDYLGGTEDGGVGNVTITKAGGAYLGFASSDYSRDLDERHGSLIALGPNHKQRWRFDRAVISDNDHITGDDELAIITGTEKSKLAGQYITSKTILALHAEDGTLAWVKQDIPFSEVAKVPDGPVIVTGMFQDTLALGGALPPLVATNGGSGYIAALDPTTGDALWVTQVYQLGGMSLNALSVDTMGNIAVGISYDTAISIQDHNLSGSGRYNDAIALLDSAGHLRWIQKTDITVVLGYLLADGDRVIASDDNHVEQLSATGVDWSRAIEGTGSQLIVPIGAADDHLTVTIATSSDPMHTFTPDVTFGDVTIKGEGLILAKLAR